MIFFRIPFILLPDEEWLQVKQWKAIYNLSSSADGFECLVNEYELELLSIFLASKYQMLYYFNHLCWIFWHYRAGNISRQTPSESVDPPFPEGKQPFHFKT